MSIEVTYAGSKSGALLFKVNDTVVSLKPHASKKYLVLNKESAPELKALLTETCVAMNNREEISGMFIYGPTAGMKLLAAACHDDCIEYFRYRAQEFLHFTTGDIRFDTLMMQITGTDTRLSRADSLPILAELKQLYHEIRTELEGGKLQIQKQTQTERFKPVRSGVEISYKGETSDRLSILFSVAGQLVSFSMKNYKHIISTEMVSVLCDQLLSCIRCGTGLMECVQEYGAAPCYQILFAIAHDDTIRYFLNQAENRILQRDYVYPSELLKDYGFQSESRYDRVREFKEDILSELERFAEREEPKLVDGNEQEIQNSLEWRLFYIGVTDMRIHRLTLDFSVFQSPDLRNEILEFLRLYIGYNTVMQVYRVYSDFCLAMKHSSIQSIGAATVADASMIRIRLARDITIAPSTISETMFYLSKLYAFTNNTLENAECNPFGEVRVTKSERFSQHVQPVNATALEAIRRKYKDLPEHVQLAFLVYLYTGARANEVCSIREQDIIKDIEGNTCLKITLFKTSGGQVMHIIPDELAAKLRQYALDHRAEQEVLDTDRIFVYTNHNRNGSERRPLLLTGDNFNYHVNKLLQEHTDMICTGRSIRAAVARSLFKAGNSASQVAKKLGNTATIASEHYNTMTAEESSEQYHDFYEIEYGHLSAIEEKKSAYVEVDYGHCKMPNSNCNKTNVCATCSQRIVCKGA